MRAFRFYPTYRPIPPKRTVEDFTAEELDGLRREFQHDLKRRRRIGRPLLVVFVIGLVVILGSRLINGRAMAFELLIAWLIFALIYSAIVAILGFPRCPACSNEVGAAIGEYCRACGAKSLDKRSWLQGALCTSCGETFKLRKGGYRARVCSVCGVPLDDEGA